MQNKYLFIFIPSVGMFFFPAWEYYIPKVGIKRVSCKPVYHFNKGRVLRNKGWLIENKWHLLKDLT